jgi:hypothetical protein
MTKHVAFLTLASITLSRECEARLRFFACLLLVLFKFNNLL